MTIRSLAMFAALALASAEASAEPDAAARESASSAFQDAGKQFALGHYAEAAASYERAAELVPHPAALLDAADAWERASDPVRAADDCELALSLLSSDETLSDPSREDYRRDAEQCVARLSPTLAVVELRGPGTMTVRIDHGPPVPVPARRRLLPGHHVAVATELSSGATRTIELDVIAGETHALDLGVPSLATTTRTTIIDHDHDHTHLPVTFWLGVGVAGASVVGGSIFGGLVVNAYDDYNAAPTIDGRERFHRWATATDVAIGVGVVAVATCVIVWLRHRRSQSPAIATTVTAGYGLSLGF